ncbi:glycosyltransferase family 4 protein [Vibrio diabolicus]|uniref:glycosyltransferase family 4 protein n=1 Tax=Vibrio diabolicus TaxID=50719 RepID=UPI002494B24F|nr:glycosyltransferase family 1 protein [Vibrio diabolicus]
MKSIAIDVRWMVGKYRGMGRYAWQLIEPVKLKTTGLGNDSCLDSNLKNNIYKGNGFFPYWEQYVLPKIIKSNNIKYLVCPYNTAPVRNLNNVTKIVVLHDLIFMKSFKELPMPNSIYQTLGRLYRRLIVPRIINSADYIITVSEFTKSEILKKYSIEDKIFVVPNSISSEWMNYDYKPLLERDDYILTVAGEAPSKNLFGLLEGYCQFVSENHAAPRLKIVGVSEKSINPFLEFINKHKLSDKVEFLGFISNSELKRLYQNSRGFIFASLFEGFGIPLIEAMASATPIACSNTTSLPEVVGNCAHTFNPYSVDEITSAFNYLISEEESLSKMIDAALHRVERYLEKNTIKEFNKVWEVILEK